MANKDYWEEYLKKQQNGQIFKTVIANKSGGSMLEIIAPDFKGKFPKVMMNFANFTMRNDGSGKGKMTEKVQIYFEVDEFLGFCNRILSGKIERIITEDAIRCAQGQVRYKSEAKNAQGIIQYSQMRLSPEMTREIGNGCYLYQKAMLRGSNNVSKQFYMAPSDITNCKTDIVLVALQGDGKTYPNGFTAPLEGTKPKTTIKIPMTFAKLEDMASMAIMRLQSLDEQNAMNGLYNRVRKSEEEKDIVDDIPAPTEEDSTDIATENQMVQPVQPAQPVQQATPAAQPVQQTQAAQTVQQTAPQAQPQQAPVQPIRVDGQFTSDFQALPDCFVAQFKSVYGVANIFFKEVPDGLRKAQQIAADVSINIVVINNQMYFHSLV